MYNFVSDKKNITAKTVLDIHALVTHKTLPNNSSGKFRKNLVYVHSEIAAIHPFADGNGRTARIVATLILYTQGYDFRKLFALEDYYNQNRPAYYKAIHLGKNYKERSRANQTNWLEYFVGGFEHEMSRVHDIIIPLSLDEKIQKKLGGQVFLNKQQIKIMDFVTNMDRIDRNVVEDVFKRIQKNRRETP